MSHSTETIVGIVERRRKDRGAVINRMREIRDIYNNDLVIPLPEMDEAEKASVPNLILRGIDQNATRITSVQFNLKTPARDPADRASVERAATRRTALLGWWEHSDLELADAQRARWFVGYGCAPAIIRPDPEQGLPTWEIRDPLDCYPPPPTGHPGRDLAPPNCAFLHRHPYRWLLDRYPAEAARLANGRDPSTVDPSEQFDVIEWFDTDETVLIGLANQVRNPWDPPRSWNAAAAFLQLGDRAENLTGMCPVVIPGRVTLDRSRGQFDASIGMYYGHAKLTALGMIGVERDVFPDMFLTSRQPGETPQFVSGPHDGRTGRWNLVEGIPQTIQQPIGSMTTNMLDRIERSEGITAGVPAEFGGESNTNIRTGRRGEQVLDAVLSYPLAEAQKILARAREAETRRAQAVAKAWFGTREKTLYVRAVGRSVTYTPAEFDTDVVTVDPPIAGTDANNVVIATGQMVGIGQMSLQTSRELSPFIADAQTEGHLIQVEALQRATMAGIEQQAATGAIPPVDIAFMLAKMREGTDIVDAVIAAHERAQERQASSGPVGTPAGPVLPGSPEAQPGLAQPGAGAEQPTAPPAAPASLQAALAAAFGG